MKNVMMYSQYRDILMVLISQVSDDHPSKKLIHDWIVHYEDVEEYIPSTVELKNSILRYLDIPSIIVRFNKIPKFFNINDFNAYPESESIYIDMMAKEMYNNKAYYDFINESFDKVKNQYPNNSLLYEFHHKLMRKLIDNICGDLVINKEK